MTLLDVVADSQTPSLQALRCLEAEGLCHGFLGRRGGFSRGPFATLNFSQAVRDDVSAVQANWQLFENALPHHREIVRLHQVHSNIVHRVDQSRRDKPMVGDGLVTAESGVILTILTADCVPILLIDARRKIAGALHAGWRGVVCNIVQAGVQAMIALGAEPSRIRAALGPSIGGCCYQIGEELATEFTGRIQSSARHIRPGPPGKRYLDLRGVAGDQLMAEGVPPESIIRAGPCTRCASDVYFSRRAAGGKFGLQLSFIGFIGPQS
jgi:polyphenol oxidase